MGVPPGYTGFHVTEINDDQLGIGSHNPYSSEPKISHNIPGYSGFIPGKTRVRLGRTRTHTQHWLGRARGVVACHLRPGMGPRATGGAPLVANARSCANPSIV